MAPKKRGKSEAVDTVSAASFSSQIPQPLAAASTSDKLVDPGGVFFGPTPKKRLLERCDTDDKCDRDIKTYFPFLTAQQVDNITKDGFQ